MLAVQRAPRMGSTQPDSDPFLPFGYSVDTNQEPLFDAPEPAPGAPLLSENDSKFLTSFFQDMTANQYNMPSFGEGLNYNDVFLDLPPQFMGTATSFGSQSTPSGYPSDHVDLHGMMPGSQLMPPPPPPPSQPNSYQQHASDDVLNAAATLLQNGSGSRSASKNDDTALPQRPIGSSAGHLRHQPLEEFREEGRKSMAQSDHENTFTEWMWGPKERRPPPPQNLLTGDYQWGSDSNFGHAQNYTPDTNKETAESMQQEQLKCLECLEVSKSAATTRPGSPVNGHGAFSVGVNRDMSELIMRRPEDPDAPPRKRRKSKIQKDSAEEEENDDSSAKSAARRRKPKSERNGSISSPPREAGAAGKRRKSMVNGTKPPRENLSEEQKRENHIRSEQKRRTLIKEGFDDLCDIVPGLKGGGFSKSTMLTMTADWLEELVKGNQVLAAQLAAIEGR